MNKTVIYEDVEYRNNIIDVQVEQSDFSLRVKDIYLNKTDTLITHNYSNGDLNVINEIMKFELGYQ